MITYIIIIYITIAVLQNRSNIKFFIIFLNTKVIALYAEVSWTLNLLIFFPFTL